MQEIRCLFHANACHWGGSEHKPWKWSRWISTKSTKAFFMREIRCLFCANACHWEGSEHKPRKWSRWISTKSTTAFSCRKYVACSVQMPAIGKDQNTNPGNGPDGSRSNQQRPSRAGNTLPVLCKCPPMRRIRTQTPEMVQMDLDQINKGLFMQEIRCLFWANAGH